MNARAGNGELKMTAGLLAPVRTRSRVLERADLLDVALAIIDEEGLGGLTMRRLAKELRTSLATVYSVGGGKEEILGALVDLVLSDPPESAVEDAGADHVEHIVRLYAWAHERMVAHPAVAQLASAQPLAGRSVYQVLEVTIARLRACGLDEEASVHAYTVLRSYITGFTNLRVSREGLHIDDERARLDALRNLPDDRFPALRGSAPLLATQMTTEHFVVGLRQILHGLVHFGA